MAYLLVMGSVLLSIGVCAGWALWSVGRWCVARLSPQGSSRRTPTPRKRPSSRQQKAAAKPANQTAGKTASKTTAKSSVASKAKAPRQPTPPWALTRVLARRRSALPLGLLVALLFGGARLAEVGMRARPHDVPVGYHHLVAVLGWTALGLLALALLCGFANWRLRRYEGGA
ncbi:hypothetical protein ACUN9Y_19075 [Halomonas sp. V046]|uniref:hypothetical protein n=1 Tax=Halomonas sp. V046 TaxID=3459611 RepID=UPI004043D9A0